MSDQAGPLLPQVSKQIRDLAALLRPRWPQDCKLCLEWKAGVDLIEMRSLGGERPNPHGYRPQGVWDRLSARSFCVRAGRRTSVHQPRMLWRPTTRTRCPRTAFLSYGRTWIRSTCCRSSKRVGLSKASKLKVQLGSLASACAKKVQWEKAQGPRKLVTLT